MNVGSISTTMFDMEAIRNRFQQFQQGEANLSKDDLSQIQSQTKSGKTNATDPLQTLISNFEKIDLDGNGMSLEELQTYATSNDLNLAAAGKSAHRPDGARPEPKDLTEEGLNQMISEITSRSGEAPAELQAMLDSFDSVDADQNGKISPDEFGEFMSSQGVEAPEQGPPPMGMMPPVESSSEEESTTSDDETTDSSLMDPIQMLLNNFDEVDANGDGISLEELQAYAENLGTNVSATSAQPPKRPEGPPPEQKDLTEDDLTQMINDITSKTGQAPSELQTLLDSFDSADADQDGKISPDELEAFMTSQGLTSSSEGIPPFGVAPASESSTDSESATQDENTVEDETRELLRMIQERILSAYAVYSSDSANAVPAVDITA